MKHNTWFGFGLVLALAAGMCWGFLGCSLLVGGDTKNQEEEAADSEDDDEAVAVESDGWGIVQGLQTRPVKEGVALSWIELSRKGETYSYAVYYGDSAAGKFRLLEGNIRGNRYEHTGLDRGQMGWYKVVGIREDGLAVGGGVREAAAVRGIAFGAAPEPVRVISDYSFESKRYIYLSWDDTSGAFYYAIDIYAEDGTPAGGMKVAGSPLFMERRILWDPGTTGAYRFVLYGIYSLNLTGDDITDPSEFSAPGFISVIN
jgi:hypothetical protein